MHKQLLIVMLICLKGADYISAQQWTETMKAIQSGSFINLDEPASDMKMSPVTPFPSSKISPNTYKQIQPIVK